MHPQGWESTGKEGWEVWNEIRGERSPFKGDGGKILRARVAESGKRGGNDEESQEIARGFPFKRGRDGNGVLSDSKGSA